MFEIGTILDCKYPTQPSNGTLCISNGTQCISKTSSTGRLVNSSTRVDVKCDSGFTLFGPSSLQCQKDGEWNFHVGVCKKGMCAKMTQNAPLLCSSACAFDRLTL